MATDGCSVLPRQESHGQEHPTDLPVGQECHGPWGKGAAPGEPVSRQWSFLFTTLLLSGTQYRVYMGMISKEDIKATCQTAGAKHHLQGEGLPPHLPGREVEDHSQKRVGAEVSGVLDLGQIPNFQPLPSLLPLLRNTGKGFGCKQKGFGQTRAREARLFSLKTPKE